jgi:hypothetical protein
MDLLETVALSKIVLHQKTFSFVEESSVNVVEELGSAKQIVIKHCQASLYEDLEKTRREYFKQDILRCVNDWVKKVSSLQCS